MSSREQGPYNHPDREEQGNPLEEVAPVVLEALAKRFAEVLQALPRPGLPPADLAKQLSLERSLTWKIWRVAQSTNTLPAPRNIPGKRGVNRFLRAVKGKIPDELFEQTRAAYLDFDGLIHRYADSRATLNSLLSRFTNEGQGSLDLKYRRDAFRARSHFTGVAAKAQYRAFAVFPGEQGHGGNLANLFAFSKIYRTRFDSPWVLLRTSLWRRGQMVTLDSYGRSALGPPLEVNGEVGLGAVVPEFTTLPASSVRWVEDATGITECVLEPGSIGENNSRDWAYGELVTNIPVVPKGKESIAVTLSTPSEYACLDLFLHREVVSDQPPQLLASANLFGGTPKDNPNHVISIDEPIQSLGPAEKLTSPRGILRHREMVDHLFGRTQLSLDDFRAYRVELRFPLVPLILELVYSRR